MKKRIAIILSTLIISASSISVCAAKPQESNIYDMTECVNIHNIDKEGDDIAKQLGGEAITYKDLPKGVVPLKFKTVKEAKRYLKRLNKEVKKKRNFRVSKCDNAKIQMPTTIDNFVVTKDKPCQHGKWLFNVTIYVDYNAKKKKFTSVNEIKSYSSGVLSLGNTWVHDSSASQITKKGKKLNVQVYGHIESYIFVDSKLTRINVGESQKLTASWKY